MKKVHWVGLSIYRTMGTSNKGGDKMGIMITVLDGDIDGVYKSPQHANWERR